MTNKKQTVVVLGGGFAGVYTAKELLKRGRDCVEVHLINRENYMVFQPMLAEVLSGSVGIDDTVSPLRRMLPGCHLHVREVVEIDTSSKMVRCSPGVKPEQLEISYDHLVVTLGTVTDFRGMAGLSEHAFPFKTLGDALRIRNHLVGILDESNEDAGENLRPALLTFVVAGGGFSGVEAMAEIQDFVRRSIKSYSNLSLKDCRFVLLHSRDRILPEMDEKLGRYAEKILAKRGIEIRLNSRLIAASRDSAFLQDGTAIPTRTLVCTVPASPNRLIEMAGIPTEAGRIRVDKTLKVTGTEGVWALGDCALIPGKGGPVPPTAQHAVREAVVCADNILTSIRESGVMKEFEFAGFGTLAALGHRCGVAQVMGLKITGFSAWWLWRTLYWAKMPGLDRKLRVGCRWALDLVFPPDLVQLRLEHSTGITQQHFHPGEVVFHQGEIGDKVYIIAKGQVRVHRREESGEDVTLAQLGAGQFFGEQALLQRMVRNATVTCLEALDVLAVEKKEFNALIGNLEFFRQDVEAVVSARTTP